MMGGRPGSAWQQTWRHQRQLGRQPLQSKPTRGLQPGSPSAFDTLIACPTPSRHREFVRWGSQSCVQWMTLIMHAQRCSASRTTHSNRKRAIVGASDGTTDGARNDRAGWRTRRSRAVGAVVIGLARHRARDRPSTLSEPPVIGIELLPAHFTHWDQAVRRSLLAPRQLCPGLPR